MRRTAYDGMTRTQLLALLIEREAQLRAAVEEDRVAYDRHVFQEELATQNAQLEEAQLELESSHEHYQQLFDFGPHATLLIDRNGVIEQLNLAAARLLEVDRSRMPKFPMLAFTETGSRRRLLDHLMRCRRSDDVVTTELTLKSRRGTPIPVALSSQGIASGSGHDQFLTTAVDLRQVQEATRERAEAAAERHQLEDRHLAAQTANDAKDRFLAALSHELRTPLTPVLLATSTWKDDASLSNPLRRTLGMIARNVSIQARLIDDLLDMTRITQGKLALQKERVDLHALIENVVDDAGSALAEASLGVRLDLAARHRRIHADPVRLRQIVANLLNNAIRFTPPGGQVVIRTYDAGNDRICLVVSDTGAGFDDERRALLFEPFEQGPRSASLGGLGLGLAIAKGLVEGHGGVISAASAGAGKGATFTVELPTTKAKATQTEPAPPKPPREKSPPIQQPSIPRNTEPLRILLVEDHEDTAIALSYVLEHEGYKVELAHSVEQAMAVAQRGEFDLLVSDLGLPDGTGLDLMRGLRAERAVTGIALTGYGRREDVAQAEAAGFDRHLVKPVDMKTLIAAIEQLRQKPA